MAMEVIFLYSNLDWKRLLELNSLQLQHGLGITWTLHITQKLGQMCQAFV